MYKKNPHIIECPVHKLHYDQRKQDGCALCIKANARLEKARAEKEKKPSGALAIFLISFIAAVSVGMVLHIFFPPPSLEKNNIKETGINYDAPFGWIDEDDTGRAIALDRMGLRTENSTWSMERRFSHKMGRGRDTSFIEFINVIKGQGAIFVNFKAKKYVEEKLAELKPNASVTPVVKSTEVLLVGDTNGVMAEVQYQSDINPFQARVYYIPAKTSHYWVFLAAQIEEWQSFLPVFNQFAASITGGMQGERGTRELPKFLISPYRSFWAATLVFILCLTISAKIIFRSEGDK